MATITFRRSSNINDVPVIDGQIVFDTARNIILMDNGNTRNQYAGATQLISTTPEATSTNAYNALATNQLFLQKTTVLDTKANALAVTQKYIPLGCLAFKEALGTTDYSRVGNGTISGGLVYLNNQMNNQLTANGNKFYFDYQDGKYGYNTDPNRGADTFLPFNGTDITFTVSLRGSCDGASQDFQGLFNSGGNGHFVFTDTDELFVKSYRVISSGHRSCENCSGGVGVTHNETNRTWDFYVGFNNGNDWHHAYAEAWGVIEITLGRG